MAERALVGEAQVGTAVGEREPDPDVRGQGPVRLADQQLAAHAEVGQQRVLARRTATGTCRGAGARPGAPGQRGLESAGPARWRRTARGCRTAAVVDGAADDVVLQAARGRSRPRAVQARRGLLLRGEPAAPETLGRPWRRRTVAVRPPPSRSPRSTGGVRPLPR